MSSTRDSHLKDSKNNSVWFLLLGTSAITLYFNTKAADPFNSMKFLLLLVTAGWLSGHLLDAYKKDFKLSAKNDYFILSLVVIFILTLFISALLTDVKIVGFLGDTQRKNGFLAYLGLAIIFLYASKSINSFYVLRLFNVTRYVGLILGVYGLMQIFGKDFVTWNNPYNSMISTLGNPNFASSILAILSSITILTLLLKNKSKFQILISLIVFIVSVTAIIRSQSIQGLMVYGAIILFFAPVYTYINYRKLGIFVAFGSITLFLISVLGMLQKGPFQSFLYKDSLSVRGFYWRAGLQMFLDKPLTGVGVDRYASYFKEVREVGYPLRYGYEITSSNAHNTYIQLFATAGIFVGMAYLLLNLYIFKLGLALIKNSESEDQKVALILLSAWVGFQAQSFISIDNIGLSVWGWLLGGSIVGLAHRRKLLSNSNNSTSNLQKRKNTAEINLFQPLISTIFLIPIFIVSFYVLKSETDSFNVRSFFSPNDMSTSAISPKYANEVLSNPLAEPYLKLQASMYLYESGNTEIATSEIKKLSELDPRNLEFLNALVLISEKNGYLDQSISYRIKIKKLDPWNAKNLLGLAKLYKQNGQEVELKATVNEILRFAPNTEIAKQAVEVLGQN
jgi:O-antigen ligase